MDTHWRIPVHKMRWRRTMDTNHIPFGTYRVATGPGTFPVHSAYNLVLAS